MARTCFRTNKPQTTTIVKFLCSYGGKILPRYPDGKLRYYGGETRVLAVDRFISFSELSVKLEKLCGTPVTLLRCQLPSEDLDALVSITSDEHTNALVFVRGSSKNTNEHNNNQISKSEHFCLFQRTHHPRLRLHSLRAHLQDFERSFAPNRC